MPRHSTVLVFVLALVVNSGCTQLAAQTEPPTSTSALVTDLPTADATGSPPPTSSPTAPATDSPTEEPGPTILPTQPPTASPAPTPTPTATAIATPTEPPLATEIWRGVSGFPPAEATVTAMVAGGPGFVAVGYESSGSDLCERPAVDSIAWTSSNGEEWVETRPEALAGLALTRLVNAGGTVYAMGSVGHSDCVDDYVIAVARSTDGWNWEHVETDLGPGVFIGALGAAGSTLIALGEDETDDGFEGAAWTSTDGAHWERSDDGPSTFGWFEDIESLGDTVIALEGFGATPFWFSADAGDTWRHSRFGPLYELGVVDLVSSDRFVGVGEACCGLPGERAGVTVVSSDGSSWQASSPFRDVPTAVVAIPGGFLTIGRTNWVSRDGLDWRMGPRLPDFDRRSEVAAVSADVGVVVLNGEQAWFASTDALDIDAWTEIPPPPEMPELGRRYAASVFLHCGWPPVDFGLRTWLPDPPFHDPDGNPPPGFDEFDHGWLTQLGENELEYESKRGRKVTLRPSDQPVDFGPCA